MHHLIYTSRATFAFLEEELTALLRWSRQWNTQHRLTGVLLYGDEQFVQVLEGTKEELAYLYDQIVHDLRHHAVTELAYCPIAERHFPEWAMAFHAAEPAHLQQVKGYFEPALLEGRYPDLGTCDELLFDLLRSFVLNSTSKHNLPW